MEQHRHPRIPSGTAACGRSAPTRQGGTLLLGAVALLIQIGAQAPAQEPAALHPTVGMTPVSLTVPREAAIPSAQPSRPGSAVSTTSSGGMTFSGSETILAGDLLQVDVEGQAKYSGEVRVSAQGAPFYNLGVIPAVAGKGTAQLADDLARRYRERDLRDPHVTVSIREYAPRRVYLIGCVQRPGVVALGTGNATTVLRAIAEAGGFTEDANHQTIRLLRAGQPVQLLSEARVLANPALDVALRPDDQLLVSPITRIYVSGEVEHSGPLVPPTGEALTASRALSMAGGLGRYASRSILVLRGTERIDVDLDAVLGGKATDPTLLPGDTVFVPRRRF